MMNIVKISKTVNSRKFKIYSSLNISRFDCRWYFLYTSSCYTAKTSYVQQALFSHHNPAMLWSSWNVWGKTLNKAQNSCGWPGLFICWFRKTSTKSFRQVTFALQYEYPISCNIREKNTFSRKGWKCPKNGETSYVKRKYAGKTNYIKAKWKLDRTLENWWQKSVKRKSVWEKFKG